jgi:hypothetical protein
MWEMPGTVEVAQSESGVEIVATGSAVNTGKWDQLQGSRFRLQSWPLAIPCNRNSLRNLVMSGMCYDMTLGGKGYLARLRQPTKLSDLVNIFAAGPDIRCFRFTSSMGVYGCLWAKGALRGRRHLW